MSLAVPGKQEQRGHGGDAWSTEACLEAVTANQTPVLRQYGCLVAAWPRRADPRYLSAGGILMLNLLFRVQPVEGKAINAFFLEAFAGQFRPAGLPVGRGFVVLALASEAALLFVVAQAGFMGGPRVVSSMATDNWLPRRFAQLSDRLTMRSGVLEGP